MSNTVCSMSLSDITACVYSDCSSGHGGDEAGAHDCPTVSINRLAGPDAHVRMYICTTLMYVCTYVQHFLHSKPVSNNHVRTWCVKSEGAGSRGYRTATQKTHHTLCVSYSKKILWE